MERLTTCPADGKRPCDAALEAMAQLKQISEIFNCDPNDPAQLKQLCDKLRGWQQAEQDGRLVELPCKVGDRLYVIGHALKCIDTETVEGIIFRADGVEIEGFWEDSNYRPEQFGKTVFLTRRESEAAVKEVQGHEQN